MSLPTQELEIGKKFFEHRDFHYNWTQRDTEEWMNHRDKYCKDILVPEAVKLKLIYYVDENDHNGSVDFTSEFTKFNHIAVSQRRNRFSKKQTEMMESDHFFIEYHLAYIIAMYTGLSYEEFCRLPSSNPDKCRLIFDLEDLMFRLINAEKFMKRAEEEEEMLREREEFRRKINKKK